MPAFQILDDLEVDTRRVLVRADLNVPVDNGKVSDVTRLERLLPTVRELINKNARVILLSHFGRPKGQADPKLSLRPIAGALADLLGKEVVFAEDCVGPVAETVVNSMASGDVAVLENLRFYEGEEANDPAFAQQLASFGDLYVNDAFSVCHRAHASVDHLAHLLPNAAGRQLEEELRALNRVLTNPERPVAAVVGGAKISTKLEVLGHLLDRVDMLVVGGGMANTFLLAQGVEIGGSLHEPDLVDSARDILAKSIASNCEIVLPVDAVIADALTDGVETQSCMIDSVPHRKMILDIGDDSVKDLSERLRRCKTLVWNGPLGAFEVAPFDIGTNRVAVAAADLTQSGQLVSVAGGGDTIAALNHAGVTERFSYVSTAGGAFLEWLEGKDLPGVRALN